MNTELIRAVASQLRYRSLEHLVGRAVEICDLDRIEEVVPLALGSDLPTDCRLIGPKPRFREGSVAKYGILDLCFTAPGDLLAGGFRTGVPLLRELGYLPGGPVGVCDDPTCLAMLQEDLAKGLTYLLLFLEGGRPGNQVLVEGPDGRVALHVLEGYLPRPFRVADACVSNAVGVWLWKHFYL